MDGNTPEGRCTDILDEDRLRHISRHVKTVVPSNGTDTEELNKFVQLFDSVIYTCSSHNLSATYRVAAWNTLCALVDWTIESKDGRVRSQLWTTGLWQRALELYLDHSAAARPKSSRQLLISLATALRKGPTDDGRLDLEQSLCDRLLAALTADEVCQDTKSSLNLLAHLLSKNILSFETLSSRFGQASREGQLNSDPNGSTLESLLFATLGWISKADFPSIVGQLVAVLLDKSSAADPASGQLSGLRSKKPPWAMPLRKAILLGHDNIDAYRSHIFPVLFRRDVRQYALFVQDLGLGRSIPSRNASIRDDSSEKLLAAALQSGKALGIVHETEGTEVILSEHDHVLVPLNHIVSMLQSSERAIRLAGLALLIESHSITKPFKVPVLTQLRRNLPHFHADTDANFRSELFSLTQRMLDRMRASTAALARTATASEIDSKHGALNAQRQFIENYRRFLAWELRQTASYQRHISALKCLSLLLRCGVDDSIPRDRLTKSASGDARWPFHVALIDTGVQRLLVDLLMDPFDDVRQSSAAILALQSSSLASAELLPAAIESALQVATTVMLASGRADHADGVAHLHSLSYMIAQTPEDRDHVLDSVLKQTERMLQVADDDLATAVDKFPLHGLLTSVRYILIRYDGPSEKREALLNRLFGIVQHVWQVVKPTLCDDAPEGYLPEEMEELPEVTTKDVLSYCWRALKEASLLMGTMLTPEVMQRCASSEFMICMFDLCFHQLAELRHRGAFSTVAQTWVACCSLMTHDDSTRGLGVWYNRAMKLLRTSLTINTRRSAGLPSLMCGLLITAKSDDLFDRAFADLEGISRSPVDSANAQEGSLPQVHALNCVKDILKNTRLAETSERYVPAALRLAADSLRSQAWAIRNCGLMLFRAVIDRLLGTNDAYLDEGLTSKKRVDFGQQPELLDLVMGLLLVDTTATGSDQGGRNEGVFPALQLLQRAQIPASKKTEGSQAVFNLTASPSWHIRDKAARTFVSFLTSTELVPRFDSLLSTSSSDQNALHGALLCAKYLLQRLRPRLQRPSASITESTAVLGDVQSCWDAVQRAGVTYSANTCPYTLTALADVEIMAEHVLKLVDNSGLKCDSNVPLHVSTGLSGAISDADGDDVASNGLRLGELSEQVALQHIRNAQDADEWLQARASYIEHECSSSGGVDELLGPTLHEWTLACKTSLQDTSIFSREAAVSSLATFHNLWPEIIHSPAWKPLCLDLSLTTYDLLNDDDEDIRISAAHVACKILSKKSPTTSLVPLTAAERLTTFLLSDFPTSPTLAATALSRAFNLTPHPSNQPAQPLPSVHAQLSTLAHHSHALFAQEKQNLYIDPAREVRLWSQFAASLPRLDRAEYRLDDLARWTLAELRTLIARFESCGDGPLGWSSDGDAFVIGLRVLYAAEVLLGWCARGGRIGVRPSELREALVGLRGVGMKVGMGVLWMGEAERVVCKALLPVVEGWGRVIGSLEA